MSRLPLTRFVGVTMCVVGTQFINIQGSHCHADSDHSALFGEAYVCA